MKKEYLKFSRRPISYLPQIVSRRTPGSYRGASYKSGGGDPDDDEEEKKKLLSEIQKKVGDEIEKRGFVPKSEVEALIAEQFKGMDLEALRKYKKDSEDNSETIRNLAEKLEKLEKRAKVPEGVRQSLRQEIRTQLRAQYDKNKEGFEKFKKGEIKNLQLELRVPATMLESTNLGGSPYLPMPGFEPGVIQIARQRPFMMSISNTGSTDRPSVVWTQKVNPEGEALFIGEGVVKPLIDFNISTTRTDAKKVADKIKVSTEMLDDIDFMASEIENELIYQIEIKTSTQLLSGDGLGDNLAGLDTFAGGYVLTSVKTTEPNNADAIRAAITQVRTMFFMPDIVVVNPIDATNLELTKASDGHYIMPPFMAADGTRIAGVRVIEETGIPVGSVLVGDMTRFRVRIYKAIAIYYGWVNDDFEKNLVTVIGEQRLFSFVPSNETGAFVYDTFANIKAAITAAP